MINKIKSWLRPKPKYVPTPVERARDLGEALRGQIDDYFLHLSTCELKTKLNQKAYEQVVEWHGRCTFSASKIFDEVLVMASQETDARNTQRLELNHGQVSNHSA